MVQVHKSLATPRKQQWWRGDCGAAEIGIAWWDTMLTGFRRDGVAGAELWTSCQMGAHTDRAFDSAGKRGMR